MSRQQPDQASRPAGIVAVNMLLCRYSISAEAPICFGFASPWTSVPARGLEAA